MCGIELERIKNAYGGTGWHGAYLPLPGWLIEVTREVRNERDKAIAIDRIKSSITKIIFIPSGDRIPHLNYISSPSMGQLVTKRFVVLNVLKLLPQVIRLADQLDSL